MKGVFRLTALLIGLLLAFAIVEIGLRLTGMGFGNSPMEPDAFLHHVHPKNYSFIQEHPSGELGGFKIEYNSEGRVSRGGDEAASTQSSPACRIAFMGDSFTEAGQVPYPASFPGLLEAAARGRCEVRNYGVRSYSPAIYLVQWTRDVRPWKPTHVFLLLFGNDVREDVSYMQTASVDQQGLPTAIAGPSNGWVVSQLRRSYTARFARLVFMRLSWMWQFRDQEHTIVSGVVEENPELTQLSTDLVLELNRRVRGDGSRLMVMAVPSRYRLMGDGKIVIPEDFHQKMKSWAAAHDIEFLDLFDAFQRGSRPDCTAVFQAGHSLHRRRPCPGGRGDRPCIPAAVSSVAGHYQPCRPVGVCQSACSMMSSSITWPLGLPIASSCSGVKSCGSSRWPNILAMMPLTELFSCQLSAQVSPSDAVAIDGKYIRPMRDPAEQIRDTQNDRDRDTGVDERTAIPQQEVVEKDEGKQLCQACRRNCEGGKPQPSAQVP